MKWCGVLAALALVFAGSACGRDVADPVADIKLDGSARSPDVEGVVEAVSVEKITVAGKTFALSRNLQSFNTYTLVALPVVSTEGSYVQLGITSNKVVWLANVARVLTVDGKPEAYYRGTLVAGVKDRLTFQDGTVLRPSKGLAIPSIGSVVVASIDVDGHVVSGLSAP